MAAKKQKKPTFYEANIPWDNRLQEGMSITVARSLRYKGEKADFGPFLSVPVKELEKRLKASKTEEKKVFDLLQEAAKAWDKHGAQTLLLQKAIEYVKTPEVKHTSNEWKKRKDGSWEISNLVYKMTFSITRSGMEWKVVWELSYMAPGLQVGYRGYERTPRERIDYEGSKKYKTMDGTQKYVQAKFDEYAECFATLCPTVPEEARALFSVNGQLLPAYKLEKPKVMEPMEATVSKLLDCLGEEDLTPPKAAEPPATPPQVKPAEEQAKTPKQSGKPKHTPKKKPHHKKKPAPAR